MNLKGKLNQTQGLRATQAIAANGATPTGEVTWSQVKNKPFSTISSNDFVVSNKELQINDSIFDDYATIQYVDGATATVYTAATTYAEGLTVGLATEEYVNAATTGIIIPTNVSAFNNDAGYVTAAITTGLATESYAQGLTAGLASESYVNAATSSISVAIDNKSLISNNGVIQEAVPIYTETVSADAPELVLENVPWTGADYDKMFYPNPASANALSFVYNPDGYIVTAEWNDGVNDRSVHGHWTYSSYAGDQTWHLEDDPNLSGEYLEFYISTVRIDGSNNYKYQVHCYSNLGNIFGSGTVTFKVKPVSIGNLTLENVIESNMPYETFQLTEQVIHKLPTQYYNSLRIPDSGISVVTEDSSGNQYAASLEAGDNIVINHSGRYPDTIYIGTNIDLPTNYVGGYIGTRSEWWLSVNRAERFGNVVYFYISDFYSIFDSWGGAGDYYISDPYSLLPSEDNQMQIWGVLHLGDIYQDPTNISIEGWESVLDGITYDSHDGEWRLQWKPGINPRGDIRVFLPNDDKKQNINAYFLPLDKQTIVTDTDGNIKTAIPACPTTTAGTFTLQATVDGSGNITYTWI